MLQASNRIICYIFFNIDHKQCMATGAALRVEHALEEVFHDVNADVRRFRIDCREEEEGDSHQGG